MQKIFAAVFFFIFLPPLVLAGPSLPDSLSAGSSPAVPRRNIEAFPIFSYDTDTKFGYGAKLFLFNLLRTSESFDLVLFNSTNGEQWYRFVFSIPDFESREGTVYPLAIDFMFDYDKWLRDNFYGMGNVSSTADQERYTKIPMDLELNFSRGFTPTFVGQMKLKYMTVKNSNFDETSRLVHLPPALNSSIARFTSLGLTLRYDSRNSFINASSGLVLQGEIEYAPAWDLGNISFTRLAACFQCYTHWLFPNTVLAVRTECQQVLGDALPIQAMSFLGGTLTLRGYPQDRFVDKADILLNAELRFPIIWRLGGVIGLDAGNVWPSLANVQLQRWAYNPLAGLRFSMDNFIVRADIGFGKEGTGFYVNFGQLF